jgi:hypothetical protein
LNNIGVPLPGKTILLGAGFILGKSEGSLWRPMAAGAVACFLSGICSFSLGRRLGHGGLGKIRWLHLTPERLKWPKRFLKRLGAKAVFIAQFIPFVADAQGRTAAIELIDGKLAISTGERMKVPVLCNGPYQQELAELGQYQPFGGVKTFDLASKPTWDTRFVRLAHRLADYHSPPEMQPPVEFAFNTLDEATAGVWQLVVDVTNRTLFFRTRPCRTIKSIDLRQCDFSTNSPIRFADLHLNVKGDIASLLAIWTPEINQSYVMSGFLRPIPGRIFIVRLSIGFYCETCTTTRIGFSVKCA